MGVTIRRKVELEICDGDLTVRVEQGEEPEAYDFYLTTPSAEMIAKVPSSFFLELSNVMNATVKELGLEKQPQLPAFKPAQHFALDEFEIPKVWRDVMQAIRDWGEKDGGPTTQELSKVLGYKSSESMNAILLQMTRAGILRRNRDNTQGAPYQYRIVPKGNTNGAVR